jgi:hypothetical protein
MKNALNSKLTTAFKLYNNNKGFCMYFLLVQNTRYKKKKDEIFLAYYQTNMKKSSTVMEQSLMSLACIKPIAIPLDKSGVPTCPLDEVTIIVVWSTISRAENRKGVVLVGCFIACFYTIFFYQRVKFMVCVHQRRSLV